MSNKMFYGTAKSSTVTFLEFGEINLKEGKKKIWDFKLHQKAYDWFMMGRYTNDIIAYLHMSEQLGKMNIKEIIDLHNLEIHHKNETALSLRKLIALSVSSKQGTSASFLELGQTLFGCIEGMEFCQNLLDFLKIEFPFLKLNQVQWHGVDISDMFNKASILLHQDYPVSTYKDISVIPDMCDVFFSKGISLLYAVRTVNDLFDFIDKGKCSVFDYSFSLKGEQYTTIGSGKTIKYLDYKDFLKKYSKKGRKLYVRKNKSSYSPETKRVFLDCIYAENSLCLDFISVDKKINQRLKELLNNIPELRQLFNQLGDETFEWLPVEDYIDSFQK